MKLVIDSMLGTLARKLRILGFDSLYYNQIDDEKILSITLDTNGILLTADKELFKKAVKHNIKCIFVNGTDEENLVKISHTLNIDLKFDIKNSRCSLCNCILKRYDKHMVKHMLPKNVYDKNEEFYICSNCEKVYWEGTHIKRILELLERVNARIVKH